MHSLMTERIIYGKSNYECKLDFNVWACYLLSVFTLGESNFVQTEIKNRMTHLQGTASN